MKGCTSASNKHGKALGVQWFHQQPTEFFNEMIKWLLSVGGMPQRPQGILLMALKSVQNDPWMGFTWTTLVIENQLRNHNKTYYSKICNIWHIQDQRVAGHCNFLDIRILYLICILVYLATSWSDPAT
jgi:hypothetical protein